MLPEKSPAAWISDTTKWNTISNLKRINEQLAAENARLNQLLKENYEKPDESGKLVMDTLQIDSLLQIQKYTWLGAKVVGSTVSIADQFHHHSPRIRSGCAAEYGRGESAWGLLARW